MSFKRRLLCLMVFVGMDLKMPLTCGSQSMLVMLVAIPHIDDNADRWHDGDNH